MPFIYTTGRMHFCLDSRRYISPRRHFMLFTTVWLPAQYERMVHRESATACRSAGDRSVYGCCPCTGPVCVGSVFVHPAPSARLQQHRSVRRDESLIGRTHIRMERLVLSHSLTRLSRSLTHQTISRLILYRLRTAIFIYKVSLYKLVSFHTSSQCRAFKASR